MTKNKTILLCYGTRPEYIKIKPLFEEFNKVGIKYKILFSGQHQDIAPKLADYVIDMVDGDNRLDSIVTSCMNLPDYIFNDIEYILVQGDTTTAMALALAAFHRKIKVIHLEAGMRTYDKENPYPEEVNRQIISRIADIHFCATDSNFYNLESIEGIDSRSIFIVGNTVLDNIVNVIPEYGDEILITMHRRENHEIMDKWFVSISMLALKNPELKFTMLLHPNPNVQKHKDMLIGVNIEDPLPYDEMINRIAKCRFLISDSGGIQEESSFLNKRVIVCRKKTEREESVGVHSFMCESPSKLKELFEWVKDNYEVNEPCPYGSGDSASKIANILK